MQLTIIDHLFSTFDPGSEAGIAEFEDLLQGSVKHDSVLMEDVRNRGIKALGLRLKEELFVWMRVTVRGTMKVMVA